MKVTLPDFIQLGLTQGRANAHLDVPGFEIFYARYNRRYLNGKMYTKVLDLATLQVKERLRGTGVLTRLIKDTRDRWPWLTLYVENASPILQQLLLKLGFTRDDINPDSFFFLGERAEEIKYVPDASI